MESVILTNYRVIDRMPRALRASMLRASTCCASSWQVACQSACLGDMQNYHRFVFSPATIFLYLADRLQFCV